jgi:DNA repair exonuclease SbcCD ATPase subunit
MIVLKELNWDNCFSYGTNNSIDFSNNTITQVLGENGHGKSSIVLILQEVLYGKNSKGIKKAEILNRNISDTRYNIVLGLAIDNVNYEIQHSRKGATTTLVLYKEGEDISEHTTTNTYKKIQDLLGLSFEDFCQLVYQSSDSSLEFLKATDTTRKKFLISLLNLDYYSRVEEKIKKILSLTHTQRVELDSKYNTISTWLTKVNSISLTTMDLKEIPKDPESLRNEIAKLRAEQESVLSLQTKIDRNNANILRKAKVKDMLSIEPEVIDVEPLVESIATIKSEVAAEKEKIAEYEKVKDTCPTCKRKFDNVDVDLIKSIIENSNNLIAIKRKELSSLEKYLQDAKASVLVKEKYDKLVIEYDNIQIDESLPEEISSNLEERISLLQKDLQIKLNEIKKATEHNEAAIKHNAKIENILSQLEEYRAQSKEVQEALSIVQGKEARLDVLKTVFSTKGLVAYKIENMIKDLEDLINEYLLEFSSGRFTIQFIVSNDKLNVELTDNGKTVSITGLSSGELARVNTSTLLAIRKLLNTLSSNRLNLLFLDEVLNVLDEEGRQKLISVLNQEENLNSFIVSHGWYHPLVARVRVYKEKGISSIRED